MLNTSSGANKVKCIGYDRSHMAYLTIMCSVDPFQLLMCYVCFNFCFSGWLKRDLECWLLNFNIFKKDDSKTRAWWWMLQICLAEEGSQPWGDCHTNNPNRITDSMHNMSILSFENRLICLLQFIVSVHFKKNKPWKWHLFTHTVTCPQFSRGINQPRSTGNSPEKK